MSLQESIRRILREEAINFKNVLIPVKLTGKLHHRTTYKNRESIQKNGLLPKVGKSTLNYMSHNFPNTEPLPMIFASDPEYAFFGGDVWEIDLRKINNVWYKDPIHEGDRNNFKYYVTLDPIPPSAIKLISSNEQYDDDFETYRQTGEFPNRNTVPEEPVTPEEPNKWDELIGKLSDEELNLNLGDLFNLKESIIRILMEEYTDKQKKLLSLASKLGFLKVANMLGGVDDLLNVLGNDFLNNKNNKIMIIKEVVESNDNEYIALLDMNENPIVVNDEDGEISQIEMLYPNDVAIFQYGGYEYSQDLGETYMDYYTLPKDILDDIFNMVMGYYVENN